MLGALVPSPGSPEPREGDTASHFLWHWPHPVLGCPGQPTSSSSQGCWTWVKNRQDGQILDNPQQTLQVALVPRQVQAQACKTLGSRKEKKEG